MIKKMKTSKHIFEKKKKNVIFKKCDTFVKKKKNQLGVKTRLTHILLVFILSTKNIF